MVENLIGTWRCVSSENFDAFLESVGAPHSFKPIALGNKSTTISRVDGGWKLDRMMGDHIIETIYPLGEEVDIKTFTGNQRKSVLIEESGRLVETMQTEKGEIKVVLSADDECALSEIFFKDLCASITWNRV